ncbi:MAG: 8-amino-7-oxononanoate synthase, partial [Mycoplasmataceae bacterium]|nr:8-amino-7-oxononanoate synthase [Mycoplasmataceae bacterium]
MKEFPEKLTKKLEERAETNALRKLSIQNQLIDFSSNDYLGFSQSEAVFQKAHQYLVENKLQQNGATGSRLLSGNHKLHEEVEEQLASFFNIESALLFNSGYDANIGLFSSVPQRGDVILYDEYIHASIRDGIRLSNAKTFSFKHNDLCVLKELLKRHSELVSESHQTEVYIVTESVFSMDGDSPDLMEMSKLCKENKAHLIVDEAHAVGVFGANGQGLIQQLKLEKEVFARIVTFGKAMGCHGAAILGSEKLRSYLVNYARSFIYTTAIPLHSVATIKMAFRHLVILNDSEESQIEKLQKNIQFFNHQLKSFPLGEMSEGQWGFIKSNSAIHCCVLSGNERVKQIASEIQKKGFDIRPILSPTVPKGQERLRICLHSYN